MRPVSKGRHASVPVHGRRLRETVVLPARSPAVLRKSPAEEMRSASSSPHPMNSPACGGGVRGGDGFGRCPLRSLAESVRLRK